MHVVSVLSQWTGRLNTEVPAALRDWFKKAFTLKTSTSPVRHAYLQAMLGAFKGQCVMCALCVFVFVHFQDIKHYVGQNEVTFCDEDE